MACHPGVARCCSNSIILVCCIILCVFTSSSHSHPLPPPMPLHANGKTAAPAPAVAADKSTSTGLSAHLHSNSNPLITNFGPSTNNDNPLDPPLQPPATAHESTSTSDSIPTQTHTSNNPPSAPVSNENNNIKSPDIAAAVAEEQSNGINPAPKQSRTLSSTTLDAIASTPMSSSLSLPKSPEKHSKMSILSVIHPALHAAFSSEKPSEKPVATKPLTKIEYHSLPLRGTEARDRAALGLLSRASSSTSSSPVHGNEGGAPPAGEDLTSEHLQTAVHAQHTSGEAVEKDSSSSSSSASELRSTASGSGSSQPYDVVTSTVVTNLRDDSGSAQGQGQYTGVTPGSVSAVVDTQRNSPENIDSSHVQTHPYPHVQSDVPQGRPPVSRAANVHDGTTSTGSGTEPENMTVPSLETDERRTGTGNNHQYQSQHYSEQRQSVENDANSHSNSNKYGPPPGAVIGTEGLDNLDTVTYRKLDYPIDMNVTRHAADPPSGTFAVDYEKASATQVATVTTSATPMSTGSGAFGLGTALDSLNTGELGPRAIAVRNAMGSAWRRMMSKVKQTFGSVLSPKSSHSSSVSVLPTPSISSPSSTDSLEKSDDQSMKKHKPMDAAAVADAAARNMGNLDLSKERTADRGFKKTAASKIAKDKDNKYAYSSEEIDDLVSDIMLQIQMHQDEMRAHKDMLRKSGRWHPDALTPHEIEKGLDGSPIFILRSSVLVSPDKLAEAVTSSTKKLLLAKGSPIPWPVASRLLVDVHSRLAQLIEPHALRQLMAQAEAQARTQALYQHDDGVGQSSGNVQESGNGLKKEDKTLENVPHGADENKRPANVGKDNPKGKGSDTETAKQKTKENEMNQYTRDFASDVSSGTSKGGSGTQSSTTATAASSGTVTSTKMQAKPPSQPQMHRGEDVPSSVSQALPASTKLDSHAQSQQENESEEQMSNSISEKRAPSGTTHKQTGQQDDIVGISDVKLHGDAANADIGQQQPHLTDGGGVEGAHHEVKPQRSTGERADVVVAGNHQSNYDEDHEGRDDHAHRSIEKSFEAKIFHDDAAHAGANAHPLHTHL